MALQVMPLPASSSATTLVMPTMPCFAATQSDLMGRSDPNPWTDAVLMRPHPAAFIAGMARRVAWKALERLMAITASHLSTGKSSVAAVC